MAPGEDAVTLLTGPQFRDEAAAREAFERILWPDGPVCLHCGEAERRYATRRPGRYRCARPACRKDYRSRQAP
jgi:hypothetical protein